MKITISFVMLATADSYRTKHTYPRYIRLAYVLIITATRSRRGGIVPCSVALRRTGCIASLPTTKSRSSRKSTLSYAA
eukprot:3551280-Pleurochrysis_carterae.AAC.3